MEIWMTASTSEPAYASAFEAARLIVEPAFNERFAGMEYGIGLVEVQYRALLHAPRARRFGEVKKYFRALHSAHIRARLEMPQQLTEADVVRQLAISLARTIERLRPMHIPNFDFERFSRDYAQFAVDCGWIAIEQEGPAPELRDLEGNPIFWTPEPSLSGVAH